MAASQTNHDNNSREAETMSGLDLLWPEGVQRRPERWLDRQAAVDLDLEKFILGSSKSEEHRERLRRILLDLGGDAEALCYRQEIIADLARFPGLAEAFRALLPKIDSLTLFTPRSGAELTSLHAVAYRAGELEILVECIHLLEQAFAGLDGDLSAAGLRQLREVVARYTRDESFRQLVEELPALLGELRTSASLTIGVNLDEHLRPEEATLLSVNRERFTSSTFLDRFLGKGAGDGKAVAPLHGLPVLQESSGMIAGMGVVPGPSRRAEPLMVPLFRDLSEILEKVTQPIARALRQYARLSGRVLTDLHPALVFYTSAVNLIEHLRACNLPVCRPEIAPANERLTRLEGSYNLNLALHLAPLGAPRDLSAEIVVNDVDLGPEGRVAILTGPNQGGKTTYIQALGLAQILAQSGMFAPARQARLSPVEGIYTHYPLEERLELGTGRFGDEARRLGEIFDRLTPHSLVLLNESLFSTNPGESLYLAQDVVRVLVQVGCRAVFITHLHELAASIEAINAQTPGGEMVISLVASPAGENEAQGERDEGSDGVSYRIVPGPPMGRSYAERIARQHGVSYEQLVARLKERGVLPS